MAKEDPNDKIDPGSGKKKKKKKKKKLVKKKTRSISREGKSTHPDPELSEMLTKIYTMDSDLQTKMEQLIEISGMSRQEVFNYLENPKHFSPGQWQKVEKTREDLEKKLSVALGRNYRSRSLARKKKKLSKKRKGKTLGSRKKWIPIR